MNHLLVLASEVGEKGLWDPTIKGVLVAIAAVVLFCGSVYLLLATNVGARLGFLIAGAALFGFMVILTMLWLINEFPLSSYRGAIPAWKPVAVYTTADGIPPADAEGLSKQALEVSEQGEPASIAQQGELKAAIEAALVQPAEGAGETSEFVKYTEANEFVIDPESYRTIIGDDPNALKLQFSHDPTVASAEFCDAAEVPDTFPDPPPEPTCDPTQPRQTVVLQKDLGSLKLPPFGAFLMSSVLFGLFVYLLAEREREQRRLDALRASTKEPALRPVGAR